MGGMRAASARGGPGDHRGRWQMRPPCAAPQVASKGMGQGGARRPLVSADPAPPHLMPPSGMRRGAAGQSCACTEGQAGVRLADARGTEPAVSQTAGTVAGDPGIVAGDLTGRWVRRTATPHRRRRGARSGCYPGRGSRARGRCRAHPSALPLRRAATVPAMMPVPLSRPAPRCVPTATARQSGG
jgi:hypothetical protein